MEEHLVGFYVGLPELWVKAAQIVGQQGEEVVEKWPQLLFAKTCMCHSISQRMLLNRLCMCKEWGICQGQWEAAIFSPL